MRCVCAGYRGEAYRSSVEDLNGVLVCNNRLHFMGPVQSKMRPPLSRFAAGATAVVGAGVGLTLHAAEAPVDEVAVKKAVSLLLEDNEPMGPTLVRLAWHAGGTYNKHTGKGAQVSARCLPGTAGLTLFF